MWKRWEEEQKDASPYIHYTHILAGIRNKHEVWMTTFYVYISMWIILIHRMIKFSYMIVLQVYVICVKQHNSDSSFTCYLMVLWTEELIIFRILMKLNVFIWTRRENPNFIPLEILIFFQHLISYRYKSSHFSDPAVLRSVCVRKRQQDGWTQVQT